MFDTFHRNTDGGSACHSSHSLYFTASTKACALNRGEASAKEVFPPIDKTEPPRYTTWHHFFQSSAKTTTKQNEKSGMNEPAAGRQWFVVCFAESHEEKITWRTCVKISSSLGKLKDALVGTKISEGLSISISLLLSRCKQCRFVVGTTVFQSNPSSSVCGCLRTLSMPPSPLEG